MSHFAGYLRLSTPAADPASTADQQARQRVTTALGAEPAPPLEFVDEAPLWLVAATVSPWSSSIVCRSIADSVGAVAGDPLVVSGDEQPDHAVSVRAVLAAMSGSRLEGLSQTRGMFAAVTWNARTRRLVLATDKLANRCLYFRRENGRVSFATSLRLLRLLAIEPERVDEQGLAEHIFFGQPLGPRTTFEGISVLEPGQTAVFDETARYELHQYWSYAAIPRRTMQRDDAIDELHKVFATAVRRRMLPGATHEEAFLSGGMDSRAVVAELVDQGRPVKSFCAAYPESIDDVVSRQVAEALGAEHVVWHRTPADRVRVALDPFAMYAREHFLTGDALSTRALWSGDGGSVMLGHVYLSPERVDMAARDASPEQMRALFPALGARPTRQIPPVKLKQLVERAQDGVLQEFRKYAAAAPDRRLFMFYALNDQARHVYHHFESIARTRVELLTPFFDSDFVALVASLPTAWFLQHGLYNDWIGRFRCRAGEFYWQPYRGHAPCPHPKPTNASDQWDPAWYSGAEVRRTQRQLASSLMKRTDSLALPFVRRPILRLCMLWNALGSARLNYEVAFARNIFDTLGRPG